MRWRHFRSRRVVLGIIAENLQWWDPALCGVCTRNKIFFFFICIIKFKRQIERSLNKSIWIQRLHDYVFRCLYILGYFPFYLTKILQIIRCKKKRLRFSCHARFQNPSFPCSLCMASSNKKSKLAKVSSFNLPLTRVRSQEEGKAFIEDQQDILNSCNVWWEPSQNIYASLLASSNP